MGARGTRLPGRSGLIRPGGEAIAWLVCTVSCEPAINFLRMMLASGKTRSSPFAEAESLGPHVF